MSTTVHLPPEIAARFDAHCQRRGVGRDAEIQRLIEHEIEQHAPGDPQTATAYELAEKLGLVGAFEGPDDLGTASRDYLRAKLRARHTR